MDTLLRIFHLIALFFPPYWSLHYFNALLVPIGQTIEMAAGGIFIALIVGMLTGIWVGAGLPGGRWIYRLLSAFRSIPDLTLAIFCVVVVGIGPAAGMLALAIFYSAAIGKIFADLFLSADRNPVDALRATGATRLSVALFGLLPLRMQDILSYGFYEFESAVRASVIVGAVGGGGIGTELVGTINALDYRRTSTLILVLILVIALIDKVSHVLKKRPLAIGILLPLGCAAFWANHPAMLAIPHAITTFGKMLPPQLPGDAIRALPGLFGETFEIAVGGTFFAMLAALPLGLLASRNLSPAFVSIPVRRFLEALRAIPEIVWGLILVSAIGIGPRAGVMALAFHATGALGRLYAESFENIPTAPVRAIASTGAPRLAVAGFAFVPLALAPIAVHTLFRLEWNVRAATIVGVIGAGGIGQALFNAQQLFFYRQMMAYVVLTWLIVVAVDQASAVLRGVVSQNRFEVGAGRVIRMCESRPALFRGRHFRSEIIVLCVRWYLRYPLSYRDLEEMMAERGSAVDHSTIARWVLHYAPILNQRIRREMRHPNRSWRVDETYVRVAGKWTYLYRAIDSAGNTIDFLLSPYRDLIAAKGFLRLALSAGQVRPRVINVDGHPAYATAIGDLKQSGELGRNCRCRPCPYLNNIIEQDHRFVKKRVVTSQGFRSADGALSSIAGYEAMNIIRKGQIRWLPKGDVVGQKRFIERIFGIAA